MKWGRFGIQVAAIAWFSLVVMWPKTSNEVSSVEESPAATSAGEGLYKSSITNANFGLLGVRFYETSEGKKRWNIVSKFAELHRKENYAFLKDVTSQFYAAKTGNVVTTKSDYGRSAIDKHSVELEGNVSIRSKRGYLFTMEKLNYDGNAHRFSSEDAVTMKGPIVDRPTMQLKGTGLVGEVDKEQFVLKKNVVAQKKMKSNDWLKITSRSGEFFTEEQRAVFIGKARGTLAKMNIESDTFEIAASEEKESMLAKGNVVLKSRDRVGRAKSAYMEVGSGKIVLDGSAQVESQGNSIKGSKIVLYTDDDRIEVESAEGRVKQP